MVDFFDIGVSCLAFDYASISRGRSPQTQASRFQDAAEDELLGFASPPFPLTESRERCIMGSDQEIAIDNRKQPSPKAPRTQETRWLGTSGSLDVSPCVPGSFPRSPVMTRLDPPEQFGRYHILRKLGEGGMGSVYLAEDSVLKRRVALKVPRFDPHNKEEAIERFYREAQVAAGIHHTNLCAVHDMGEEKGFNYLTMTFIEGTPLSDLLLPETPQKPRQAFLLVRKIAQAIGILHDKGLIHRDIKPGNIIVQPDGEPVLVDFGLTRSFKDPSHRLTTQGQLLGSPAYMAPEQLTGTAEDIQPTTDLYSLGVILYEMLTGKRPFEGETRDGIWVKILFSEPEPPSQVNPVLDTELDALVLKAIARERGNRYPSTAEFIQALDTVEQKWEREGSTEDSGVDSLVSLVRQGSRQPAPFGGTSPGEESTDKMASNGSNPDGNGSQDWQPSSPTQQTGSSEWSSWSLFLLFGTPVVVLLASLLTLAVIYWPSSKSSEADKQVPRPDDKSAQKQEKDAGKNGSTPPGRSPSPALTLVPIGEVVLEPGQRKTLTIRVEREHSAGPVEVRLQGLPAGVQASPETITIPADADEGETELSVARDVTSRTITVALRARGDGAEATGDFVIRVEGVAREVTNSLGMKMVLVPAGKFQMGSPAEENNRGFDEDLHEVEITHPFYLGIHEVTQDQYARVMGENPSYFSATGEGSSKVKGQETGRFPVEMVSWSDAREFCRRLSALPEEKRRGSLYRLPTEAEWEYACRAGTSTAFHFGEQLSSRQANFAAADSSVQSTTAVGSCAPNAWGLHDLHGNVWEWCQDWYDGYDATSRQDPNGPRSGDSRVLRGGSWADAPADCRSANRSKLLPPLRTQHIGFRVVLVLEEKTR
jgi:formylglycine-generating enzyme required for sulfatase activity/serine/threonine protein kinase